MDMAGKGFGPIFSKKEEKVGIKGMVTNMFRLSLRRRARAEERGGQKNERN